MARFSVAMYPPFKACHDLCQLVAFFPECHIEIPGNLSWGTCYLDLIPLPVVIFGARFLSQGCILATIPRQGYIFLLNILAKRICFDEN